MGPFTAIPSSLTSAVEVECDHRGALQGDSPRELSGQWVRLAVTDAAIAHDKHGKRAVVTARPVRRSDILIVVRQAKSTYVHNCPGRLCDPTVNPRPCHHERDVNPRERRQVAGAAPTCYIFLEVGTAARIPVFEPVSRPRRHPVRTAVLLLLALLIVLGAVLLGVAWYFSDQLLDVTHSVSYTTPVLAAGRGTVTLGRNADTDRPGIYGIEWAGGHAVMGRVTKRSSAAVTRMVSSEAGTLRRGTKIRLTASIYQTPADVRVPYRTVHYPDPLGPMPAWYVPAKGHIWAIIMHGYTSQKTEGIRAMPVYHALGMPVLDIAYRNDTGAPSSPDHLYHLGATEWKDVAAAATYALAHGARGLVLMGYSLGGNLTEEFLHHSHDASRVRAVVLDSPALDWDAILNRQATDRHLPAFATWVGKRVIAYRLGLSSLGPVDTDKTAGALHTPTLLFDGRQDNLVPFKVFTSFVDHARPGTVTVVTIPRAGHTEPWNVAPHRYDTALRDFLTNLLRLKKPKRRQ